VRKKLTYLSLSGKKKTPVYERIRQILESARSSVARTVNTTQVIANWLIGREIVEDEQKGHGRAEYGQQLILQLSEQLKRDFGTGYSAQNLSYMRQFYQFYPSLIPASKILHALRGKWDITGIPNAMPRNLSAPAAHSDIESGCVPRSQSWQPGQLHPNLSWTHYRTLLHIFQTPSGKSDGVDPSSGLRL
jgi:hypothetical protein